MKRFLTPIPIAVAVAVLALVGLLAYGLSQNEPDRGIEEALARGERVKPPALELPRLSGGGRESLADYRGKVVVLNFWASWCDPCVDELPLLERTHRRIRRQDALVLGVNYKDLSKKALAFKAKFGLTFPLLRDRDGRYAEQYGSRQFPETFVIDRKGRVAAKRAGPVDEEWLDETLPPLLAES